MNSRDPWAVIVTDAYGDIVYPRPRYGHPFYTEVPSWIHYGDGDLDGGTTRQLFDGVFVGGESDTGDNMNNIGAELTALSVPGAFYGRYGYPFYGPFGPFLGAEAQQSIPASPSASPVVPRRGLTAEVGPVLAPATGGIMVKKHLDDKQVLHVEICVDGKCHKTSMDLAPAIAMLMQKLATWHEGQHAPQPPPSTVVSTIETAVGAAEDLIVGALVARHIDTVCGSFIGDIAGAASSAVRGLTGGARGLAGGLRGLAGGVSASFKKLKGPIGAAASIAAASAASAIPGVGPIAAPIAAKLANNLVQAAAGNPAAQKAVEQAAQQAQTDPATAAALDAATKAVANSTVAHHVEDTAKKAAQGDNASQQQIVAVAEDAQKGDPAAKAVADLVANAMKSEWGAALWEKVTGRGPSTVSGQWYDVVVGAAIDDVREKARAHAVTKPGTAAGVLITVDGRLHGRGFRNLDDAIDWLQHITRNRGSFTYAAAYEKDAEGAAYIQAEEIGGTSQPAPAPTTIPREAPATTGWW